MRRTFRLVVLFLCVVIIICSSQNWDAFVASNNVQDLNGEIWEWKLHKEDILFMCRGSHSSGFGGMGSVSFKPKVLPVKVIIGRTWSDSGVHTDHVYRYTVDLVEGDAIEFSYNATIPINIQLSQRSIVLADENKINNKQTFVIPKTGNYYSSLSLCPEYHLCLSQQGLQLL